VTQVDYSSAQTRVLFALMDSAPAELLHFLTHAALQPLITMEASQQQSTSCQPYHHSKKTPPYLTKSDGAA